MQRPVTEGLAGEWTLGDGQLLESVDGCGADSEPSERRRESFARQLYHCSLSVRMKRSAAVAARRIGLRVDVADVELLAVLMKGLTNDGNCTHNPRGGPHG